MSGPAMLFHLVLERLTRRELPRVPEPNAVMDDPEQVAAFMESGRDDGVLAFTHLYHALQSAPVIKPGDIVLDLACGPANQLAHIARINPHARFVGLDASANMLDWGRATLARWDIGNVDLVAGDMTRLAGIGDATMDCVLCTMSLHHLRDPAALSHAMHETRRVLKPNGGLYLADFGRLRRAATQRFFAQDQGDRQSAQFTRDYLHSLQAAFSVAELSRAAAVFGPGVTRYQTALAPFMVIFKSGARRRLDATSRRLAQDLHGRMTAAQQRDFQVFARWFHAGGHRLPCSLA